MVKPKSAEDLHLPSDLAGITVGTYDDERTDGRKEAAVGPFCNKVSELISKLGTLDEKVSRMRSSEIPLGEQDVLALLHSYLNCESVRIGGSAIQYSELDEKIGLPTGSTKKHIKAVVARWNYQPVHEGENYITFERPAPQRRRWISDMG